jgi:hypothetical protein
MTTEYAARYADNVRILGRQCADALRRHVQDEEPDRGQVTGAAPQQGGPKFWMTKLAELLAAMMKDPQVAALISGQGAAAPALATAKVPPQVPAPGNPTGASAAAAQRPTAKVGDSLDALVPVQGRRAQHLGLDEIVRQIKR